MATIDYKEKYEKAVQAAMLAKQDTESAVTIGILEEIFPELRESEDERIRKEIIKETKGSEVRLFETVTNDEFVAWLEKQGETFTKKDVDDAYLKGVCDTKHELEKRGEQKPADLKTKAGNWYVCDMEVVNENMVTAFRRGEIYYCPKDGYLDVRGALFEVGCLDVFRLATKKEIPQPKQEWSEEDEKMIRVLISMCDVWATSNQFYQKENKEMEAVKTWLKSLRPQNTWKPSDEQMIALKCAITTADEKWVCMNTKDLESLYQDLKKLKE